MLIFGEEIDNYHNIEAQIVKYFISLHQRINNDFVI